MNIGCIGFTEELLKLAEDALGSPITVPQLGKQDVDVTRETSCALLAGCMQLSRNAVEPALELAIVQAAPYECLDLSTHFVSETHRAPSE
jgi:hypothetical protein